MFIANLVLEDDILIVFVSTFFRAIGVWGVGGGIPFVGDGTGHSKNVSGTSRRVWDTIVGRCIFQTADSQRGKWWVNGSGSRKAGND